MVSKLHRIREENEGRKERRKMNKKEIKRLAKDMAALCLRGLLDRDAMENGLEVMGKFLNENAIQELEKEIQAIIERIEK
jgi:predicted DNA-binding transcriptional regulator